MNCANARIVIQKKSSFCLEIRIHRGAIDRRAVPGDGAVKVHAQFHCLGNNRRRGGVGRRHVQLHRMGLDRQSHDQKNEEDEHHVCVFHLERRFKPDPKDVTLEILMHGIDARARAADLECVANLIGRAA